MASQEPEPLTGVSAAPSQLAPAGLHFRLRHVMTAMVLLSVDFALLFVVPDWVVSVA